MYKKKGITLFLGLLIMILMLAACRGTEAPAEAPTPTPMETPVPSGNLPPDEPTPAPTPEEPPASARPEIDREGYAITLPDEINTIVTIGPAPTEILVGLGFADRIISTDRFSADVEGLPAGVAAEFGIMDLDAEYIVNLMPDVIFIAGMARGGGDDDPMAPVAVAGITVIYMPTSTSIAEIKDDIRFIAAVMEVPDVGESLISVMEAEIDAIAQIAASITETRTVYFEISPAPWTVSFGAGTFLNEMIELVGATNIFADYDGWISVAEEVLLTLNPDVILTSTGFLEDPIAEIAERPGFDVITAVLNGDMFQIDENSSSRPTHNITRALREIAEAVFPEYFG